jgi:hypothetical protein
LDKNTCEKTSAISARYFRNLQLVYKLESIDTVYSPTMTDGEVLLPTFSVNANDKTKCSCTNYLRQANLLFTIAESSISSVEVDFIYKSIIDAPCDSTV